MIVRVAAARGMIETAGDKTSEVIVEMLKSTDKPIQTVAIATLKEVAKDRRDKGGGGADDEPRCVAADAA